jgi:hypothetical protein
MLAEPHHAAASSMICAGCNKILCFAWHSGYRLSVLLVSVLHAVSHWVPGVHIKVLVGTKLSGVDIYGRNNHICMLPAVREA